MGLVFDAFKLVDEFVNDSKEQAEKSIQGAENRSTASAAEQLTQNTSNTVSTASLNEVQKNPIVAMGLSSANQAVTQVTQGLVVSGTKKLETAANQALGFNIRETVRSTTEAAFSAIALASTAKVEIIMELARTNAREIVRLIGEKNAVITELKSEIKTQNKAGKIMQNRNQFFSEYHDDLIVALGLIENADARLKSVVSVLRSSKKFNTRNYDQAVTELEQAKALILPPEREGQLQDAGITAEGIRGDTFLQATFASPANQEILAAALSIPAISARIGELMLSYAGLTVQINGLLAIFLTVLDDFISTYQRNDNVDKNTINHITSATDQLDSLIADMRVVLDAPAAEKAKARYPFQVTTSATGWGIRVVAVIEWLRVNPGKASQILDITGESVERYKQAVTDLQAIGDQVVGLARLRVPNSAQEDPLQVPKDLGKLLLTANTAIASNTVQIDDVAGTGLTLGALGGEQARLNTRSQFLQADNLMDAALQLDAAIVGALQPFIDTPFELLEGADRIVKQMAEVMDDLGLDRGGDLLRKADIKGFYAANSKTLTYVGAAAAGLGVFLDDIVQVSSLGTDEEITDQEFGKVQELKAELDRQNDVKQVETARSGAATKDAFVADQQTKLKRDEALGSAVRKIAEKRDEDTQNDPVVVTRDIVGKAVGKKFSFS